ncbi:HD domain-containing protein [Dactylosporangium sp. NPDC049742]|uniref:HD domain-containing protein n=1 Tax=Dactylosporangium sp. NPDC049742 TaxID=3154737 RepID=UPI00343C5BFE
MDIVTSARAIAETLLAEALPRRWNHVRAVGATASHDASRAVPEADHAVLIAAAWLHDIGYAPGVASSGLHALDGARWLRDQGHDMRIAALVAYHSCAVFEAAARGLSEELAAEFSDEQSAVTDALWYADMTTGPDGQRLSVHERLAEIRARYGPDDIVTQFWAEAEPTLLDAVRRTEERLAAAQPM